MTSYKRKGEAVEEFNFDEWSTCTPDAYSLHTQFCWNSKQTKKLHVMPWDLRLKSPSNVFTDAMASPTWNARMPPLPVRPGDFTASVESEFVEDAFAKVGLRAVDASDKRLWQERLSWERKCACKKWCSLILMKISAWAIGMAVASGNSMQYASGGLMESVVDALASRATSTLHARAGPLLKFAKFWRDKGMEFFPVQESMVYDYIKSQTSWAPTAPRSLLISLSFAFHVFGLSGGDVASKSGRIKGVADSHYSDRRKVVQRPPLKVAQIMALEDTVHDASRTSYDRIAAGFFLLLVYGRLRYSDGLQLVNLHVDSTEVDGRVSGFLEAQAERTKTSVTLERKVRFLPVAIPLDSLVNPSWVHVWMNLREEAGLNGRPPHPMLPSPQLGGGWSQMPLSVASAGDWLRSLLKIESVARDRVATHSCKATLLSMAAKYGMDCDSRRMLGYHSESKNRSMLVYSRDSMSAPLRKLISMLASIKSKKFFPDATRSGYFVPDEELPPGANVEPEDDASDGSSSRGSISEEECNHDEDEAVVSEMVGTWAPKGAEEEGRQYARHRVSRCIHAISDEAGINFVCGRAISNRYVILLAKPAFMHPVCGGCFRT